MMFTLFQWGFVSAMLLTWLAIAVGALLLLIPVKSVRDTAAVNVETKRAA